MITFVILLIALIAVAVVGLFASIAAGNWFIIVFGDFIVFGLIVWLIVTMVKRLKKKK
jgi:hypothetical protein